MLRNVSGDKVPFVADDLGRLTVVGSSLEPLPGQWEVDRAHESAVWAAPVDPGGVALKLVRTDPEGHRTFEYRPLSIVDEWQVLVFVPNTSTGPAPQQATIHMAASVRRLGFRLRKRPDRDRPRARALGTSHRTGGATRPSQPASQHQVPESDARRYRGARAAAEARPNFDLLETVLRNLGRLLGEHHPDFVGLRWLREEARSSRRPDARAAPAAAGQMAATVLAAYQALLRLDSSSPAPWRRARRPNEPPRGSRLRERGRRGRSRPPHARRCAEPDPARERVADYVRGVAALHGITEQEALAKRVNEQQTALSVGFPVSLVNRVLGELRAP